MKRVDKEITCGQLRKRLKSFFEDLLSDDEYEEFIAHTETCWNCQKYVRSFGELSNQIWKLGRVKVPSDFEGTAFYKLRHPIFQEKTGKRILIPKWAMASVVLACFLAVLFLILVSNHRPLNSPVVSRQNLAKKRIPLNTPPVSTFSPAVRNGEQESDRQPPGVSKPKEIAPLSTGTLSGVAILGQSYGLASPGGASVKNVPMGFPVQQTHLHVVYSEDPQTTKINEKKHKLQTELASWAKRTAQVYAMAKHRQAAPETEQGHLAELVTQLEEESQLYKKESANIEAELKKASEDKDDWQARHKQKILAALHYQGVELVSQPSNMIIFSASSRAAEKALEEIYTLFSPVAALEDFEKNEKALPDLNRSVSIYIEDKQGLSFLHWHLTADKDQQEKFVGIVQEANGSIDYQEGRLLVCRVPKTEIGKCRAKIQALRIGIKEFGSEGPGGNVLSTAPEVISVYFLEE